MTRKNEYFKVRYQPKQEDQVMAAVIPINRFISDSDEEVVNPLKLLRVRKICWDDAYLPNLPQDKQYLYISFKPSQCQLTEEHLKHLRAIQVRGIIWLGVTLIELLRTKDKNYVMIFTSDHTPTRLKRDSFTFREENVTFHFLNAEERNEITCQP